MAGVLLKSPVFFLLQPLKPDPARPPGALKRAGRRHQSHTSTPYLLFFSGDDSPLPRTPAPETVNPQNLLCLGPYEA